MTIFNLTDRMIDFSVRVIQLTEKLPKSNSGLYFSDQIMRSVSSAILNYSEAQSAESRKDFIHKVKVSLKELRETFSGLKIIEKLKFSKEENIQYLIQENNELISILVTSIKTARRNMNNSK